MGGNGRRGRIWEDLGVKMNNTVYEILKELIKELRKKKEAFWETLEQRASPDTPGNLRSSYIQHVVDTSNRS